MRNKLSDVFYLLAKIFGYYIECFYLMVYIISLIVDICVFCCTGNKFIYTNEIISQICFALIFVFFLIATIFFGLGYIFEDEN